MQAASSLLSPLLQLSKALQLYVEQKQKSRRGCRCCMNGISAGESVIHNIAVYSVMHNIAVYRTMAARVGGTRLHRCSRE